MTKGIFQLQCYCVLTHAMDHFMAIADPIIVGVLSRVAKGKCDCVICRRTLDLKSFGGDSTPGILGYMHGDLPDEVNAVGVAVCCACVRELGDKKAAMTISQMFVNECGGGGTVELVQGGTA